MTEFFDFPSEGQFHIEVSAIDMEDNRRVLRVPINIEKLRGLNFGVEVEQYKSGKVKLFGFFVGQVMKESGGKANPQLVNEILKKKL